MSTREFIALGTSSQVPTRHRNHNGYLLRWDDEGFLFDPGEGTQRQMTYGDLSARSIHRVFITHFHGDHCLGLAGILQRLSLDRCEHPVSVHYPASGQVYFERLRHASIYHDVLKLLPSPVSAPPSGLVTVLETDKYRVLAHALDHPVPTVGYRLEERSGRTFLPEKLAAFGLKGPLVGQLQREGRVTIGDREVTLEDVTVHRPGCAVAFVMDTRACEGAVALARDADLLVMEATYTAEDQALADDHGHATSVDAARTALSAGARRLCLTHFSQRYLDTLQHLQDARAIFPQTQCLRDLDRVVIPRRTPGGT
ncbi:MAG: ribonuclease Z [Deltaproteobacteria bacterium]|nr:ribonuclease Z [Deltaproteobacteria bacterium]